MLTLNSISALLANHADLISIKIKQTGIKMSYDPLHKRWRSYRRERRKRGLSLQGYGAAAVIGPDVQTASLVSGMINGGKSVHVCVSVYMR